MRWLRRIVFLIESRQAQTFYVSISKKSSSGPDEKTDDLRDRCCYHPPRSLGGCNAQGEHNVSLQTRKERHALALLLSSAWRPLPRRNLRGADEEASRTSGE